MPTTAGVPEVAALCATAFSVGAIHTVLGPDHYVPFVAMSRAGGWSTGRTMLVTAACGLAHVGSSIVIGLVGLALGVAVLSLEGLEALRGDAAAWLLIGFGLSYLVWGLVRAMRSHQPHDHAHVHADGTVHAHRHAHDVAHLHPHAASAAVWTPWILFLIFAFGPCEPLIPLLMYPAAKASPLAVAAVVAAFTLATVATMVTAVVVLRCGVQLVPPAPVRRYAHALAGLAVLACGVLVMIGL
jgi:nickel/cobalt transporter (NicO) family protein